MSEESTEPPSGERQRGEQPHAEQTHPGQPSNEQQRAVDLDGLALELRHDPELSLFGAWHKGSRLSFASYVDRGGERIFHHTETLPAWGGRGIAGEVVRFGLDTTIIEDLQIVPVCSYVADFVRLHGEWDEHLRQR